MNPEVEDNLTQDFSARRQKVDQRGFAETMYTLLALLCKDETARLMMDTVRKDDRRHRERRPCVNP